MIVGLVLAAGGSQRFGRPKQLELFRGRTFLEIAIDNVRAGSDRCYVALGAETEASADICQMKNSEVIHVPGWVRGQRQTLKSALQFIFERHEKVRGILVGLCDQILLEPDHYQQLRIEFLKSQKTIATEWSENSKIVHGAPILWKAEDLKLIFAKETNDSGGQELLQAVPYATLNNTMAILDVDRPSDLLVAQSFDRMKS